MARNRFNKSSGKGTSFGKQSDAEKAFYKRPKTSRFEETGKSSRERQQGGQSHGSSRPENERTGKSYNKNFNYSAEGKRKSYGSRPDGPPRFSKSAPFRKDRSDSDQKPFAKRKDNSSYSRPEGPPRFSKSAPFRKDRADSDQKAFTKRRDNSSYSRPEGPPRFNRSAPRGEFKGRKNEGPGEDSFRTRPSGQAPFKKRDDRFRDKKPFRKDQPSFVQARVIKSGDFTKPARESVSKAASPAKEEGLIRLNKYIANAGIGSRRQADELIKMGLISINGTTITELGSKVKPGDIVRYEDRVLKAEKLVYVLLNKPKGFITTTDDPQERNTVMGLVAGACKERIYPVGRLDRNTTGLLLLTNDGDLADKLTHPSYNAKKVYKAELDKPITKNDLQKLMDGVRLEEGKAVVDDVAVISDDHKTVGLEIHIGWNRVVRRIFEALGYEVVKLDRSVFAGLDKKDLGRGQWRFLKPEEVVRLKHFK